MIKCLTIRRDLDIFISDGMIDDGDYFHVATSNNKKEMNVTQIDQLSNR